MSSVSKNAGKLLKLCREKCSPLQQCKRTVIRYSYAFKEVVLSLMVYAKLSFLSLILHTVYTGIRGPLKAGSTLKTLPAIHSSRKKKQKQRGKQRHQNLLYFCPLNGLQTSAVAHEALHDHQALTHISSFIFSLFTVPSPRFQVTCSSSETCLLLPLFGLNSCFLSLFLKVNRKTNRFFLHVRLQSFFILYKKKKNPNPKFLA